MIEKVIIEKETNEATKFSNRESDNDLEEEKNV